MRRWVSSGPSVSAAADRIPSGLRLVRLLSALIVQDMSMLTAHVLFLQSTVTQHTEQLTQEVVSNSADTARDELESALALEQQIRDFRWAAMNLYRHIQKLVHVIGEGQSAAFAGDVREHAEKYFTIPVSTLMQKARVDDILKGLAGARAAVWEMRRFFEGLEGSSTRSARTRASIPDNNNAPTSSFSDSSSDNIDFTINLSEPGTSTQAVHQSHGRSESTSNRSRSELGQPSTGSARRVLSAMAMAGSSLRRAFRRKPRLAIPEEFRESPQEDGPISTLSALEEQMSVSYTGQTLPLLQLMDAHIEELQNFWKDWGMSTDGHWVPNDQEDMVVIRGSWVKREWDVTAELAELEEAARDQVDRMKVEKPKIPFEPI
ncbi:hypothetical protein CALCODRAFT_291034 [Calocera cornea HHB12733]|uniref:Uncharacterized protein n=1 Tax=Calocera cornea HHB12733 TaxID=1353952 RepID=A0A165FTC2_9BASI|nr:hypothetical protein CALCODRAFT_291034 [Calocera cornea HHB12733]